MVAAMIVIIMQFWGYFFRRTIPSTNCIMNGLFSTVFIPWINNAWQQSNIYLGGCLKGEFIYTIIEFIEGIFIIELRVLNCILK